MAAAHNGDTVQVHYTGRLEDGTIFDSSTGGDPLQFTIGEGTIIPGFEKAIVGKSEGDTVQVSIPPEEAYGPYRDELLVSIGKDRIPSDMDLAAGQQVQLHTPSGQPVPATVTEVTEDGVTVDANHPLAGKTLHFEISLVSVL